MIVETRGISVDVDIFAMQNRRFYLDLADLVFKHFALMNTWAESSKVASAYAEATGEHAPRNAYELDALAQRISTIPYDKYTPHPSTACLRAVAIEETGTDHRYCLYTHGGKVHVGVCRLGHDTAECCERMRAAYRDWREHVGEDQAIPDPGAGEQPGDPGEAQGDNGREEQSRDDILVHGESDDNG